MSIEIIPNRINSEDRKTLSTLAVKKQGREILRAELLRQVEVLDYEIVSIQADYGAIFNKDAPIFSLPIEVMCLIFLYALCPSMDDDEKDEAEAKQTEIPLLMEVVVSHVCQRWRTVAHELPQLWSSFGYDSNEASRVPIDRLEAYLHRSGTQTLELFFDLRSADEDAGHLALVEKSIPHVERWRRVTILADNDTVVAALAPQLADVSALNLEYLALRPDRGGFEEYPDGRQLETQILKGGAPKLTSVWLDTDTPFCLLPPLSNIVTLRLEEGESGTPDSLFSWGSFLEVLAIPSLTNLSLVSSVVDADPPLHLSTIMMDSLVNLRFSDCSSISNILLHLRAPRLKSLIMQYSHLPHPICSLPKYTFPSLRELNLTECECSGALSPIEFLNLTEAVTHLTLTQDTLRKTLIPFINGSATAKQMYWPNLEHIMFNFQGLSTDIMPYISFVKFRSKRQVTIRIFEQLFDYWASEAPDNFRTLKRACHLRLIDGEHPLEMEHWPPGEDIIGYFIADDADPFDINPYLDTNLESDSDDG